MKKINSLVLKTNILALSVLALLAPSVWSANAVTPADVGVTGGVSPGFKVPNMADVIGFMMKFLFFFAGLSALLYLLLGAMAWVTSSGDKENVKKAQDKIQAAVLGLVILVVVIVLLATLEQVVLKNVFCVGLTCNINIPSLVPAVGP